MNEQLNDIQALLEQDRVEEAITESDKFLSSRGGTDNKTLARAYYLRGNARRRRGETRLAMNDYLAAIDLDPDSPATQAYRMAQDVLNFYDHDLYNP